MFVSNRMVKDAPTVAPERSLAEAFGIMDDQDWEALPVIDDGGLVGIITVEDIMRRVRQTRDFSVLDRTPVGEAATRGVSIQVDDIIEEAAFIMKRHNLSALPVVDEAGRPVGVITERMIYGTLVDMMGLRERGTRITLFVEDRIGVLADIAQVIKRNLVSIASLSTFVTPDRPRFVQVVVRVRTVQPERLVKDLREDGYRVTHVSQVWE